MLGSRPKQTGRNRPIFIDVDFAIVSPIKVIRTTQTEIFFIGIVAIVKDVEFSGDVASSDIVEVNIDFVSSTPNIGSIFNTCNGEYCLRAVFGIGRNVFNPRECKGFSVFC